MPHNILYVEDYTKYVLYGYFTKTNDTVGNSKNAIDEFYTVFRQNDAHNMCVCVNV